MSTGSIGDRCRGSFERVSDNRATFLVLGSADPGLLHSLLEIDSERELLGHPRCGASWEGFAIHEAVRILDAAWDRCHYWATHTGAEIDLFTVRGGERIGVEAKRTKCARDDPVPPHGPARSPAGPGLRPHSGRGALSAARARGGGGADTGVHGGSGIAALTER